MLSSLLDIIFPKVCISCNREEGTHLCEDCLAIISLNTATLPELLWATSYQEPLVRNAISSLKYPPFLKDLALPLASLIIAHLALLDKPQNFTGMILCPIPLHKRKLKWRGFNQAQEIAKHLSQALSIPLYSDILLKTKNTTPQIELQGIERRINMLDVFEIQRPELVQNKNILLVDDVYTTGATMREAQKVLQQAGAKKVTALVVARG